MADSEKLPSETEIKKKIADLLDAKKFEEAAKLICYYTIAKMDPEKFAHKLYEAATKYVICKIVRKHHKCICDPIPPFCQLVEDLAESQRPFKSRWEGSFLTLLTQRPSP